jgi:hypothetical protein
LTAVAEDIAGHSTRTTTNYARLLCISIGFTLRNLVAGSARQNAFGSLLIQGSLRLSRFVVVLAAAALLTPPAFATVLLTLALTDLVRGALQAFDVDGVRLISRGDDAGQVVQTILDAKALAGLAGLAMLMGAAFLLYGGATAWLVALSGAGTLAASFASSFLVRNQAALTLRLVSTRVSLASLAGTVLTVLLAWLTRRADMVIAGVAAGDLLQLLALQERTSGAIRNGSRPCGASASAMSSWSCSWPTSASFVSARSPSASSERQSPLANTGSRHASPRDSSCSRRR